MKCDFCDERKGIQTVYNLVYGRYDRIVYETENFVVFPCMGQLREGHLLIASKKHYNAVGQLDDFLLIELDSILNKACCFIKKEYGKMSIVFEHGVLEDDGKTGGCGIYHLHLHIIPAEKDEVQDVFERLQEQKTNDMHIVNGLKDTTHYVQNNQTYVFCGQSTEDGLLSAYIITNDNNYFESQYMRKIVANVFGKYDWNWKNNKDPEHELLSTAEKAKRYFK